MKTLIKREIKNIYSLKPLRRAINKVQDNKQCTWCTKSAADVQSSLKDKSYEEEYRISALCGSCQDQVFIGPQYLRKEVQ